MTGMAAFLAVCIWKRKDGHKWRKALSASFLSIYYYLLYLYTIVFRPQYSKPQYELALFWSYRRALNGSVYLWIEIILNYILFVPIGLLMPVLIKHKKTGRQKYGRKNGNKRAQGKRNCGCTEPKCGPAFAITVLTGILTSLSIEISQLCFRRGLFEWDDIIGNTVGTIIGYSIYKMVEKFGGCMQRGKNQKIEAM